MAPEPARISGQRRYAESAVAQVGIILLLRDAGFSLAEQKALAASRDVAPGAWRELHRRKLAELDEQLAKVQAARAAIEQSLHCPHEDILDCPSFGAHVSARLAGQK